MHDGPTYEDHAHALRDAVLLSSRYGMCVHFESACVDVCETYNLEVLLGDGGDGSRPRHA